MKKLLIIIALSSLLFAEVQTKRDIILFGEGFTTQDGKFRFNKSQGLFFCTTLNTLINIGITEFDWKDVNGTRKTITVDEAKGYAGEIFFNLKELLLGVE